MILVADCQARLGARHLRKNGNFCVLIGLDLEVAFCGRARPADTSKDPEQACREMGLTE